MLGSILLGIFTGLNIALIGMGIVLIFKTGKYINFAQAQLGVVPMLLMGKMALQWGLNWYLAFAIALVLGAVVAVLCETLVVRPLSKLGSQAVLVGTVGVAQVLLGLAYIKGLGAPMLDLITFGYPVPFEAHIEVGGATFFAQHILTLIAVPSAAALLWLFLSRTLTGKSIRAAACNEEAARLSGLSIRRLSIVAWAIAGVLATIGAVLAAPNSPGFDPSSVGPALMFSALGAAALAGFSSFPQVVLAAVGLNVIDQVVVHETSDTSKGTLALFLAILVGLILRRKSAALQEATDTLRGAVLRPGMTPAFRTTSRGKVARFGFPAVLVAVSLAAMAIFSGDPSNLYRLDEILIICAATASISLLAGLTGQLSLGQAAFVGLGAGLTAKLTHDGSSSLVLNLLVAAAVTAAVSALVALPSLRGGTLMPAVTTLGFGVVASVWLFNQSWLNPGNSTSYSGGGSVPAQHLPLVGSVASDTTIFVVILVGVVLLLGLGTFLQRSPLGLRMTAVRFNEQGARSMGINVVLLRIAAVSLAGAIAGAAGALDVSANQAFNPISYNPQLSLVILSLAVIGGLGSLTGAIVAAALIYGVPLFLTDFIEGFGGNPIQVQLFLGGGFLVVNLLLNPGGLSSVAAAIFERLSGIGRSRQDASVTPDFGSTDVATATSNSRPDVGSPVLRVSDVSQSFDSVRALEDVSLTVGKNEVVGLIGNNGAGKTTLLNCVAGDLRHEGEVELFGQDVASLRTMKRARLGLGRTFQDASLFPGLTTAEVLRLASLSSVKHRRKDSEGPAEERAQRILGDLGLVDYADTLTADLPTGVKRQVELGIQLARVPGLILLDEPAAGLGQAEAESFGPRLRHLAGRLGSSVLMIEHDLPLMLSIADRIYCLELGKVIAVGTPDEIRANPAVIESYFGSPEGVGARRSGRLEPVAES